MIENRNFRVWFWRGCFAVVACLLGSGCTTSPSVQTVEDKSWARLVMENRTDYVWHLSATSDSGKTSKVRLDRRATLTLALPAGDYRVEQSTDAGVPDGPLLVRTLPIVLLAGMSYHWPLLTLLADETTLLP